MSSLPPSETVTLTNQGVPHDPLDLVHSQPTTIFIQTAPASPKRLLLHRSTGQHQLSSPSSNYSPLSFDALQTHYRPAPQTSPSLKHFLPIPESITSTTAYAVLEPFLFPLLFPLGCCTAILHSIYMVLPIFPAAIIVGVATSIIVPFIFLGTISVTTVVILKALARLAVKQYRALNRLAAALWNGRGRAGMLRRRNSDDGRAAAAEKRLSSRASLKPGPSILKPSRPVQVYEELPPSPISATVRPRAASFSGSGSAPVSVSMQSKAKEVFKLHLRAEKDKERQALAQVDGNGLEEDLNPLPTPPATPSSLYGLDIPPFNSSSSSFDQTDIDTDGTASPRASSPPPTHYFATNPRFSVSSIDLHTNTNTTTSTASSSYAPTPKTPGSPLVQPKVVKHVRIIDPADDCDEREVDEDDPPFVYEYEYGYDAGEGEGDEEVYGRPLREFAALKLQDALGLLQGGAGQVWGA